MEVISHVQQALYGGIRPDVPGHGGEECTNYLDRNLMLLDTSIVTLLMAVTFTIGLMTYTLPQRPQDIKINSNFDIKTFLLVLLTVIFGIEVGFKLASQQSLYLLNPCHILTMIEIYLLAVKPSRTSIAVLRILIHYLYGALIAMLLPDTHARMFHGEIIVYWVQHFMIFAIVPPYLVYRWGLQILEPFKEISWAFFTGSVMGIHHMYILQPLSLLTQVNLNFMLCPSNGDPFNGPYYRLAAVFHQALCLLCSGKLYTLILWLVLPKRKKD